MHESHAHKHDHQDAHDHACCAGDANSASAVADAVGAPAGSAARLTFKVQGLDCAEEVAVLKHEVGPLIGGEDIVAIAGMSIAATLVMNAMVG